MKYLKLALAEYIDSEKSENTGGCMYTIDCRHHDEDSEVRFQFGTQVYVRPDQEKEWIYIDNFDQGKTLRFKAYDIDNLIRALEAVKNKVKV